MLQITLPLVTLGITRNPGSFAAVTFVQRLPWLLFALHAGALADRLDRRRTMALVNLGRTALLAAFAVVVAGGAEQLWTLYLVAFVLGIGETLFDTAAQSILPAILADKEQLSKANGQLTASSGSRTSSSDRRWAHSWPPWRWRLRSARARPR